MIAPMGNVVEMLPVPEATPLPGVQPWVAGLANVRGRLLPLFDLEVFFGKKAFIELYVKVNKNWRSNANQLKRFGYNKG